VIRLISGGPTGADQGGLLAGRDLGVQTGGWAPQGWRTEAGAAPWLADFGLREHASSAYPPRTAQNVHEADATVIFGTSETGSVLTARLARGMHKPLLMVNARPWPSDYTQAVEALAAFLGEFHVVNIAGNRESKNPGMRDAVWRMIFDAAS
jgi:hypothetical protein